MGVNNLIIPPPTAASIGSVTPKTEVFDNSCDSFSGITSFAFINQLDEPVYIVRDSGYTTAIPGTGMYDYLPDDLKDFTIVYRERSGPNQYNVSRGLLRGSITASPTVEQRCTFNIKQLRKGPIYVRGLSIVICLGAFKDRAVYVHPSSTEYLDRVKQQLFSEMNTGGSSYPISIHANLHQSNRTHLFVEVNDSIMTVEVAHDVNATEGIFIDLKADECVEHYRIPANEISDGSLITKVINNSSWVMSFDRSQLVAYQQAKAARLAESRTKAEVELLVSNSTLSLRKELAEKDQEIERLKRELAGAKTDLRLSDSELARAIAPEEKSFAQETLRLKRDTQIQAVEQERLKAASDRCKMDADIAVAEARVAKEKYSTQGAETNAIATGLKAAATIAPIVAAAAVWLATRNPHAASAASMALGGGSIAASVFANANAIMQGAGKAVEATCEVVGDLASGVVNCGKKALRKVGEVASDVWEGTKTVVTKAAKCVGNAVSSAVSYVSDACSAALDWAFG